MQQNCTAFMKTSIINEKIVVDECYTHHGHEKEIQHIWLSSEKRRQIAAQINEGVSVDRILKDIREETLEEDIKRHQIVVKVSWITSKGPLVSLTSKSMKMIRKVSAPGSKNGKTVTAIRFFFINFKV